MKWRSVRVRLTLWNVLVLALVMIGLITVLLAEFRSQELGTMDRELSERAEPFLAFAEHHLFNPKDSLSREERYPGKPLGEREPRRVPSEPVSDQELERLNWFRSPRYLDETGQPVVVDAPAAALAWDARVTKAALAGNRQWSIAQSRGERVRVLSVPVHPRGRVVGLVQIVAPLRDFDRRWSAQAWFALCLLPPALLISALGGLFLANRALRPVERVTCAAARIGEGDLSQRLVVEGNDELAHLSSTFNEMIAKLDTAFQSRAAAYAQLEAAFEQQKRFTADASHELRTPLTRIKTATSAALQAPQSLTEYQQALSVADQGADTMTELIAQLLLLARADSGQLPLRREVIELNTLLHEVGAASGIDNLLYEFPAESIWITGDEPLLACVFRNLLDNAARHTPEGGQITMRLSPCTDSVHIHLTDTGEGIGAEHLPHLFERFYRVDASRTHTTVGSNESGGTGLGLSICSSIVQVHGGTISIVSQVGQGTEVTVALPFTL